MPLNSGHRLGPYEILSPLGAGGMGEVYEARDTRLGRTVAIKVLPEGLAENPDRRARFEREARTISQLSHPHVCTLHDVGEEEGIHFLVMEHLEGETLAERLERGALPVKEALRIAGEIADALEEAHRHGVVHRDLKPGNLIITENGSVKVLDFGLARLVAEGDSRDRSHAVTLDAADTRTGAILGTTAYMSPEQARGEPADRRSDLWALGAVLWETLTGERPLRAPSAPQTLSAILEEEPPWDELPRSLPPAGRRLLRRCLAKQPEQRLHHAADARLEIEDARREIGGEPEEERLPGSFPRAGLLAAVGLALIVAGILGWWIGTEKSEPSKRPLSLHIDLPPDQQLTGNLAVAIDPGGREIVYSAVGEDGIARLYRRRVDRDEVSILAGTEGATSPFFSPDGVWVAFLAKNELRKLPVEGGSILPITGVPSGELQGGAWLDDGTIVFSAGVSSGLFTVDANGGESEILTEPDPEELERGHWYPSVLPGQRAVLFTVDAPGHPTAIVDLQTGSRHTVTEGVNAHYVSTDQLVFRRDETLMVAPFDLGKRDLTGPARPVSHPIPASAEAPGFDLSHDGVLVSAVAPGGGGRRLTFVDRDGSAELVTDETRSYALPRISPSGRWISFEDGLDIWLLDLDRRSFQSFTVEGSTTAPVWAPESQTLAFHWTTAGSRVLGVQHLGETEPEIVFESSVGGAFPTSWSRDGRYLVFYVQRPGAGRDLWVLPMEGEGEAFPYLATPHNERAGVLSPDGRWLAYVSNRSGSDEVYLSPFPEHGDRRWQISAGGGLSPQWSFDGREITFRHENRLVAIEVTSPNGDPVFGPAEELFPLSYPANPQIASYDPTPAGRFLMPEMVDQGLERIVISFDRLGGRTTSDPF